MSLSRHDTALDSGFVLWVEKWFYFHLWAIKTESLERGSGFKEPIKLQKKNEFLIWKTSSAHLQFVGGLVPPTSSTHEPNSLIFYTSKLKRCSCPTCWVELSFSYISCSADAERKGEDVEEKIYLTGRGPCITFFVVIEKMYHIAPDISQWFNDFEW